MATRDDSLIQVHDLKKHYHRGAIKALDGVTVDINKGDVNKVVELDSRFHDIICKASKNRPLRNMMSSYHNFVKLARHKSLTKPERIPQVLTEHRSIMQAIAAGDSNLARSLAVEHSSKAKSSIATILQDK